jgi:hypothetical protein
MNNPGVRVRERKLLKMTAEETFVKLQAKQGSREGRTFGCPQKTRHIPPRGQ